MGYGTLDSVLSFERSNVPPSGSLILITDTLSSEGNFLIHHFIANHLKENRHVVLVGFNQTLSHYQAIGKKLGIDLSQEKSKSLFSFIDGLTSFYCSNDTSQSTADTDASSISQSSSPIEDNLRKFYVMVKEVVAEHPVGSAVSLVIDDLSTLLFAGIQVEAVLRFVKNCRLLIEKNGGSLTLLVHGDDILMHDINYELFVKSLMYQSEYILSTRGLSSGYSRDVSGDITIARGPRNNDTSYRTASWHYKTLDNNVQFFAKGHSAGI
ncbi:11356_t:CDS:2 [Paraglomus occultum]|uniref:11356_t:CDS:1 n=1 Tax=Paraglomus occultum TaxID=144539 RepID=A0A9N9B8V9_9GLOM|nr:11356_t:CDS:2 [Paraglomus occultum]